MAQSKNLKPLVKRLKKQVSILRKKEKAERNKLRTAMRKVNKLTKMHKSTLDKKAKATKAKVDAAVSGAYLKLAKAIQKKAKKSKTKKK